MESHYLPKELININTKIKKIKNELGKNDPRRNSAKNDVA